MSLKNKQLIFLISIVFLVFPLLAKAQFVDPIGIFDTMLEGVEEPAGPLIAAFIKLFLYFIVSYVALIVSAFLFSLVINNPNWIDLGSSGGLVDSGWHFMVGLANMFMILILVFIAIQFILRIETFSTKKTLVTLLIVALLLNFSLLFTRIIVDVPIFAFNTFARASGGNITNVVSAVISPLTGIMSATVLIWGAVLGTLAGLCMVPVIGPFVQLGFVIGFPFLVPILAILSIFTIAGFLLAGVFLAYVFLFGARAIILAIFAILSPLAFLALILPQTKKYFHMWLKTVIEWAFLGVILLFFMVLGFRGLTFLTPGTGGGNEFNADPSFTGLIGTIKGWFIYYFFLFIYLLFLAGISKKLMPSFAQGLISGVTQVGGMIWARGIKPMGKATGRQAGWATIAMKEKEAAMKREKGEAYKPSLGMKIGTGMAGMVGWGYRRAGTTVEREANKDIEEMVNKKEKKFGKDVKSAMDTSPPWKLMSPQAKATQALYLAKVNGKEGLEKLTEERQLEATKHAATFVPHRVVDIAKYKSELINDRDIERAMVPKGLSPDEKEVEKLAKPYEADLIQKGHSEGEAKTVAKDWARGEVRKQRLYADKDVRKLAEQGVEETNLVREAAFTKAADALKETDFPTLDIDSFAMPEFRKAIIRSRTGRFIQKLGEENQGYADLIHEEFDKMSLQEIAKTNAALLRQTVLNDALRTIFPLHRELVGIKQANGQPDINKQLEKIANAVELAAEEMKTRKKT